MHALGILFLLFGLAACDKPQPIETAKSSLPFKAVPLRDGSTWHTLRLPDGNQLMIKTTPSEHDETITSVSVMQKDGIAFVADYQQKEYFYSSPPFDEFEIWTSSTEGNLFLAPEARHKKHAEASGLFSNFFDETLGKGMNADEAMKEAEKLKEKLREVESKK